MFEDKKDARKDAPRHGEENQRTLGDKDRTETDRTGDTEGFVFNEEGGVVDVSAQRRLALERERANTAPNDRVAGDHSAGTPQHLEENTADNVHSDGGPTPWIEPKEGDFFGVLDPKGETLVQNNKEKSSQAKDSGSSSDC